MFKIIFLVSLSLVLVHADWDEFKDAAIRYAELGIQNDPSYLTSRSNDTTRALNFPCSAIPASSSVPTSVHRLRPSDIKVIGAIGDSLTAANGAKASLLTGVLTEYRGVSWSMGGDGDVNTFTTLPNMLRRYNPALRGYSLGSGNYLSNGANFNIAQPGHTSHEMLAQAQLLVKKIQADTKVDFNNDWKLITFFVGGNDLCKYCKDRAKYQPINYINNIQSTLDFLQSSLPRTLINLVLTLDVTGIQYISGTFVCRTMQNYLCDCGINQANAVEQNALVSGYQTLTTNLVNSGRYDVKDDFTVVLQPFMSEMKPPLLQNGQPDYSYFAPDCFHFSVKGHETAALELWNNMFQPVGQKDSVWAAYVNSVKCPSEARPFIYTRKNSNLRESSSLVDLLNP